MIGAIAYNDPAKDSWRNRKWKDIADSCTGYEMSLHHARVGLQSYGSIRLPPQERARQLSAKTVLYLVGPEDHDRVRAKALGFANHNLIAVDLVQSRIDEVRADGGFGIRGSLQQVIMNWPHDWPIDVIDADLCSGLVNDIITLPMCMSLTRAIHKKTVVSINLMRGRDAQSNDLRKSIIQSESLARNVQNGGSPHVTFSFFDAKSVAKNRAASWIALCGRFFRKTTETKYTNLQLDLDYWNAKYNSYRSKTSGQYFDSVVHTWGMDGPSSECSREDIRGAAIGVASILSKKSGRDDNVKGRISALRAVIKKHMQKTA